MRWLLLAALSLSALPSLAQTDDRDDADREVRRTVVINGDTVIADGARFRFEMNDDGPGHRFFLRRGDGEEETFAFRMPDREHLEALMHGAMDGARVFFDGDLPFHGFGDLGASDETRGRMRELEAEARRLAAEARTAEGAERRDAEAALGRTLDALFDVRAEARRERAEALRERAAALEAEADEVEAGLADREARRRQIIEARRAALLGESPAGDW